MGGMPPRGAAAGGHAFALTACSPDAPRRESMPPVASSAPTVAAMAHRQQEEYQVLTAYAAEFQPREVEFLGSAGGFSGALFWRLLAPRGLLCLRRWPSEHPSEAQLRFIQAVLRHADQAGFHLVPVPYPCLDGRGYVVHGKHLWDLSPWMQGKADYHESPTEPRLSAALVALAQFHLATASVPVDRPVGRRSPGIADRRVEVRHWMSGDLAALAHSVQPGAWPELDVRAQRVLALVPPRLEQLLPLLDDSAGREVPLQPCLRDVWHDHILFQGDRVTGLIDFGAMGWENVAADLARLLGSMVGNDAERWRIGLAAYQSLRPLSAAELRLVRAFDMSNSLLGGLHWIDWIYRRRRVFENRQAVLGRLDEILLRIEGLAAAGLP